MVKRSRVVERLLLRYTIPSHPNPLVVVIQLQPLQGRKQPSESMIGMYLLSSSIVSTRLYIPIPTAVQCILLYSHIGTSCILDRVENTIGGVHTMLVMWRRGRHD